MSNIKKEILLIGGGGHCKSVIDVIEQENKYKIVGIVDKKEFIGEDVLGYKIIASDDDLEMLFEKYKYALVTIGQVKSNTIRVKLFTRLKKIGYQLPTVISPLSYVSKHAKIEEGTVIMHYAMVNAGAKVAQNCIINSKALLEHDSIVEEHCHISTCVVLNGGVRVKSNSFVGSNSTSKENTKIQGFVKAGSVAT